ncbi:MAG: glucosyl-3-phosphoglycerate synthase [Verrucomicrobia bacterium]|nr:MAG: glucosyl-3-phosphoglycerate synthase [Verrucomicrobiota bacterium]
MKDFEKPPPIKTQGKIFQHREFSDLAFLLKRKRELRHTISLCIPTLNEEATIGAIVRCLRKSLLEEVPLLDEILVIDSGSTDNTQKEALAAGASVFLASEILPQLPPASGKGENLWKSLFITRGDLLCFLDGDIRNMAPHFVYGLIGPLLAFPELDYVKAFYERPATGVEDHSPGVGGGRVTEILIRPLLSLFLPELTGIFQPLAGEYAARRSLLEQLPFPTGYGVETALLIDIYRLIGMEKIAQTDLDMRIHRHQTVSDLGVMAFILLKTFLKRIPDLPDVSKRTLYQIYSDAQRYHFTEVDPPDWERPPADIYRHRPGFGRGSMHK